MLENTADIIKQIALGEDSVFALKIVEFSGKKITNPHRNSMADELAAMANTTNGVFVLGVDDKTKSIVGIPEEKLDLTETWLRGICNDLIKPQLFCRIRKVLVITGDSLERLIIRVDVPRSLFVHLSPGGYFNRIGSSKRQMMPDVLARLFQQRSQTRLIRFDEQAVPWGSSNCLSKSLWNKFTSSLSPENDKEFLIKMKLITLDEDGKPCPSVSGVLMASEKPHELITNAFIQAVAYRGTERNAAYQLDARDIEGPLDKQLFEACKFVEKNMRVYAIKQLGRQDIPQYSMSAVFEAIVNAVAHRDYSIQISKIRLHLFANRLELFSPGTIPNTMTVDTLPFRQATRNELLASLLARCPMPFEHYQSERKFIMDKRGEGVPIIITESEKLSGCKPEYLLLDNAELKLTIFAAKSPHAED